MTNVRIITEPLGGSPLSRLIQSGGAPEDWIARAPTSPEAWKGWALTRARSADWSSRLRDLSPAFAATGAAAERLERVRTNGGIVVTTGQQPGLFGGPVYTFSKALGALALADCLEQATGLPTAAVFWAATDDADFAEASYTVVAHKGGADLLRSAATPPAGTPMSLAPIGDIAAALAALRLAAGSAATSSVMDGVERAYQRADATVGGAYVALLRDLFAPLGIPVLDASHEAVRRASDDVLRTALERSPEIARALERRSTEITQAGFEPQVADIPALSPVFVRDGSVKRRVSIAESSAVLEDQNAVFTPNVLLRAVVEQHILPTVAYLGGPGELAYFAQVGAVADALQVERPLALPRWSCTLVEPRVDALLAKFNAEPADLASPDEFETKVARAAIDDRAAQTLQALRDLTSALPDALGPELRELGLQAAAQGAAQSLLHRIDRLERRITAGIKRREAALFSDIATLRGALYPKNTRQERALNLMPLLSRHGLELLREMRDAARAHAELLVGAAGSSST